MDQEVWVLDDPGGIQVREVKGNTGTVITVKEAFSPTPLASAIFVVCEKVWKVDRKATPFVSTYTPDTSGSPDPPVVATVDATALQGSVALWQVLIEDADGNESVMLPDAVRDIYVMPVPGAGDEGPVHTVVPVGNVFTPDLAFGMAVNQKVVLTADSVLNGPINGRPGSSTTWTLIVDEDATGGWGLALDPAAYFHEANILGKALPSKRSQSDWILDQAGHNSLSGTPLPDQPIPA
jgi:hypothetical protein